MKRSRIAQSFDVDEKTRDLMIQLRQVFGCETNAQVITKSLALATIVRKCINIDDTNITIKGSRAEYNVNIVD